MKRCPYCGNEMNDAASVCLRCGKEITAASTDSSSVGYWWLGFLFPLLGFVLWAIWTGDCPKKAKRVCSGAIVGIIVSILSVIVLYAAYFFLIFYLMTL